LSISMQFITNLVEYPFIGLSFWSIIYSLDN
jgi:hypothetical protein